MFNCFLWRYRFKYSKVIMNIISSYLVRNSWIIFCLKCFRFFLRSHISIFFLSFCFSFCIVLHVQSTAIRNTIWFEFDYREIKLGLTDKVKGKFSFEMLSSSSLFFKKKISYFYFLSFFFFSFVLFCCIECSINSNNK